MYCRPRQSIASWHCVPHKHAHESWLVLTSLVVVSQSGSNVSERHTHIEHTIRVLCMKSHHTDPICAVQANTAAACRSSALSIDSPLHRLVQNTVGAVQANTSAACCIDALPADAINCELALCATQAHTLVMACVDKLGGSHSKWFKCVRKAHTLKTPLVCGGE